MSTQPIVDYRTEPSQHRHIRLAVDVGIATRSLAIDEAGEIRPVYTPKRNRDDLAVKVELRDALNRIRLDGVHGAEPYAQAGVLLGRRHLHARFL